MAENEPNQNPINEQVDENAESAVVDETTKNNVLNDDVSASVHNKDVMEASDYENEEKNNDEDDAGNQGAEESDQQERKDDEDDAGNQGAGESGQQEGSGKNEDARNDNKDVNNRKIVKKDANEGDGTKEATNQKNEKEEAGLTYSQILKALEESEKKDEKGEADLTDSQMLKAVEESEKKEKEEQMYLKMLEDCDKMLEQRNKEKQEKAQEEKETEQIGPSTQSPSVPFIPGSQPTFDLGFDFGSPEKANVEDKLTDDEKLLGRSIFSMQGEEAETVFNDKDGNMLMRMSIQSLALGLEVETPVIDTFASILNYEERFSTKTLKRHCFNTGMMLPALLEIKKLKPEEKGKMVIKQYEMFQHLVTLQMKEDLPRKQIEDIDLVFFPIISSDHYYLIVFNIEKVNAVIIDNSKSDATYDGKYKDIYELVFAAQFPDEETMKKVINEAVNERKN
ncbi:hypothetical protein CTI12_AA035780 [Artemisia annua]|uniref:Ulp1 protease family, C-terminal catalytic domain-containing protein n=1 Tax=Artemisia annua TaxID=35608 RepID=A0A2U1PNZ2_ARTAN|nr:hypothetical protein CTI12_AA035780 [Artemisia annua]